jgi:hypothetical protein
MARLDYDALHFVLPLLPVFAGALLLPGPFVLRGASLLLAVTLALDYAFVIMDVNRCRRLAEHRLPEDLEDVCMPRGRSA